MFHVEHDETIARLFMEGANFVGITFTEQQLSLLTAYFHVLQEWNKKINLTGLKTPEDVIAALFLDSIAPYAAFIDARIDSLLDVGSGAGFPGLALKIMLPGIRISLLEPRLKRAAFLDYVIGTLNLHEVTVIPKRIEQLAEEGLFHKFPAITMKAVFPFTILPYIQQLLSEAGKLYLWRATPYGERECPPGMEIDREIQYVLPFGHGKRTLSVLKCANALHHVPRGT